MFMQEGKWNKVLKFKKMRVYKVNQYFEIWSSLIFETKENNWFANIKKLMD